MKKRDLDTIHSCLASESPEIREKVIRIVENSGLDASDPLFLILALTGQMRVFLETAPEDLQKLLFEWKQQSSESLKQLQLAMLKVETTQQQQASAAKKVLEQVTSDYVANLKRVGSATTSAIANSNNETVNQAQRATVGAEKLKDSVMALRSDVQEDKEILIEGMKLLMERVNDSAGGINTATEQINRAINDAKHLRNDIHRLQKTTEWIRFGDWFWPLFMLFVMLTVGFGSGVWLTRFMYNDNPSNVLGRNLADWNLSRILKCQKDKNPKCTIWIVPPPERRENKK